MKVKIKRFIRGIVNTCISMDVYIFTTLHTSLYFFIWSLNDVWSMIQKKTSLKIAYLIEWSINRQIINFQSYTSIVYVNVKCWDLYGLDGCVVLLDIYLINNNNNNFPDNIPKRFPVSGVQADDGGLRMVTAKLPRRERRPAVVRHIPARRAARHQGGSRREVLRLRTLRCWSIFVLRG